MPGKPAAISLALSFLNWLTVIEPFLTVIVALLLKPLKASCWAMPIELDVLIEPSALGKIVILMSLAFVPLKEFFANTTFLLFRYRFLAFEPLKA